MIQQTVAEKEKIANIETSKNINLPKLGFNSILEQAREPILRNSFRHGFIKGLGSVTRKRLKSDRSIQALMELGDFYLLDRHYKPAFHCYLKAHKSDSLFIPAIEKLILIYILQNKYDLADEKFRELLNLTNNRLSVRRNYSSFKLILLMENKIDIAELLILMESVLKENPKDFEMLNTFGFIELNIKNNIKNAKEYFKKSLAVNENFIHTINNLGVCYLKEGRPDVAINLFKRCLQIDKYTYPFAYFNLAIAYIETNKNDLAIETLKQAQSNNIVLDNHIDHTWGWLLIQDRKYNDAIKWYIEKIKSEPYNNLLLNNLGFCYMQLGQLDNAKSNFEKAIRLFKNNPAKNTKYTDLSLKAFYNLGRLANYLNDIGLIGDMSREILEINRNDSMGIYLAGVKELRLERFNEASALFKEAVEINKHIPEIYTDYSFILSTIENDYDAAIRIINEAIKLGYRTPTMMNNLAYSYILSGDLNKAEKIVANFDLSLNPAFVATKGMLEIRKGNLESGNNLYSDAIKRLKGKDVKIAEQIKYFENSLYYFNQKEYFKAREYILKSSEIFRDSYMKKEIESLSSKINKVSN